MTWRTVACTSLSKYRPKLYCNQFDNRFFSWKQKQPNKVKHCLSQCIVSIIVYMIDSDNIKSKFGHIVSSTFVFFLPFFLVLAKPNSVWFHNFVEIICMLIVAVSFYLCKVCSVHGKLFATRSIQRGFHVLIWILFASHSIAYIVDCTVWFVLCTCLSVVHGWYSYGARWAAW